MILWEGPSRFDGAPLVVIATGVRGKSRNGKTGDIVQTWILRADMEPQEATANGSDASLCGDCPHRTGPRSCYVNVVQAPLSIYRAYRRGSYGPVDWSALEGRLIRFGAYGDPGAVPTALWRRLARLARAHTGYTHAWRRRPSLRNLVMASADNETDREEAQAKGWRTFRILAHGESMTRAENHCPADRHEHVTCADCMACDGASDRRSIAIPVHGPANKVNAFNQRRAQ